MTAAVVGGRAIVARTPLHNAATTMALHAVLVGRRAMVARTPGTMPRP